MLDSAIRNMLDLSTAHLTKTDALLMNDCQNFVNAVRIAPHENGFIMFVSSIDTMKTINALLDDGFSSAFINMYARIALMQPPIMLINFDKDAEVISDLPTFDW